MEITTNLGYSFSKLEDLVRYMEEENITEVILGAFETLKAVSPAPSLTLDTFAETKSAG